jgi:putative two-component system response regulator
MARDQHHSGKPTGGTVLVVDDLPENRRLLERLLVAEGHVVLTAADGREALDVVRSAEPEVIVMDVRMPNVDGFEACRRLKATRETRLIPVVLMTGSAERADRIDAIEAGADDFLTKPVDESELRARVRSLMRFKRHTDELDSAEAVIMSLALTIEARDPSTNGHCQRLAVYGVAAGRRMGLDEGDLAALRRGGYLHDIGKIAIPDAILMKPGPLTADELDIVRQHPVVGDRLCGKLKLLQGVRPIVRHHHERLDGSGYPDGLEGDAIPLLAHIISVVDIYDALTTERPYKPQWPEEQAVEELRSLVERGWLRADVVRVLEEARQAGELTPPADDSGPANG